MNLATSTYISGEKLQKVLLDRDFQAGHETLHGLAQVLEGVTDPEQGAARISRLLEGLVGDERLWLSRGIAWLALAEDPLILAVAAEAIDQLELLECQPALALALDRYPRKFGAVLRKRIGHIGKQLQDRIWALPPKQRAPMEMDNILRRGMLEYSEPEAQATHTTRWLADYFELVQRRGDEFSVCRAWVLDNLEDGGRIARLASLELCGIFRIREAIPLIERMARLPAFQTPDTAERRALTIAASQLRMTLDMGG